MLGKWNPGIWSGAKNVKLYVAELKDEKENKSMRSNKKMFKVDTSNYIKSPISK